MSLSHMRLGSRTLKTALSVLLCILLFKLFERDAPMIACLAAIFALRQDMPSTILFGIYRVSGNLFGGIVAIFYFYIYDWFGQSFIVELFLIPALVVFIIVLADAIDLNAGIIGACATFFIIVLTVPAGQTFWYAFDRVLDTLFGTIIAIAVNYVIKQPEKVVPLSESQLKAQIVIKAAEIAKLEATLGTLYTDSDEENK